MNLAETSIGAGKILAAHLIWRVFWAIPAAISETPEILAQLKAARTRPRAVWN
jgi:hypothetical protein